MSDLLRNIVSPKAENLFKQEVFQDIEAGQIIINTPVNVFGITDLLRQPIILGACNINTPRGPMPFQFEIKNATNLEEAMAQWASSMAEAMKQLHNQSIRNRIMQGSPAANPNGSGIDLSGRVPKR